MAVTCGRSPLESSRIRAAGSAGRDTGITTATCTVLQNATQRKDAYMAILAMRVLQCIVYAVADGGNDDGGNGRDGNHNTDGATEGTTVSDCDVKPSGDGRESFRLALRSIVGLPRKRTAVVIQILFVAVTVVVAAMPMSNSKPSIIR